MDCITIKQVKEFMGKLLMKEDFDKYLLQEAEIVTCNIFRIDGHVQKAFYSNEEYEELGKPVLTKWENIRPFCYGISKGHKTPVRFKIVLRLSDEETIAFMEETQNVLSIQDVGGLYLNLVYENDVLNCITGTYLNIFTMDKSLEKAWDKKIQKEIMNL